MTITIDITPFQLKKLISDYERKKKNLEGNLRLLSPTRTGEWIKIQKRASKNVGEFLKTLYDARDKMEASE